MVTPSCSGLCPLAREILAYLRRHPKARDTLEGINEWWLLEQRVRSSVAETKAALDQLTERRFVLARRGRDGRLHYCGNVRKRSVDRGARKRQEPLAKPARSRRSGCVKASRKR
ncbi:MAG: hypothetical protein KJ072_06585 [Verrucomicrobia bacterium]|nr:hypothetical protein [Verrucomicrobiota bacterium]